MLDIKKCNVCKLEKTSCNQQCMNTYKMKNITDYETSKIFCTAHMCKHNITGLQCSLDNCAFHLDEEEDSIK